MAIWQPHRIISQESIRPSSPTPPHLKTHNLSLLDQFVPDMHTPVIFFYRNFGDTNILKQSLSQTLTQYYPFAGRFPTPSAPYIDCNDQGVEFLEANFNDSLLDDFIFKKKQDQSLLDQLFPYGLSNTARQSCPKLLEVQLNHFAGGGAALALSISHKLADAATAANFINHWAAVTRCGSPLNPCFLSSPASNKTGAPKLTLKDTGKINNAATRIFVFPNSKLNDLKNKVIAMGKITNPSRVEVLTSLIYKHAAAAATKSGSLGESNLSFTVNIRSKFVQKYPETTAGNLFMCAIVKMVGSDEIRLSEVISALRKRKLELEGIKDEQQVIEKLTDEFSTLHGDIYYCSSLCNFPFYEADFGWGKPVEVTVRIPDWEEKNIMLMDTPSGHGITALVHLPEEDMAILQKDKDFLTYVEDL